MEFKELYITEEILKAIEDMGFKTPSPIQEETIPPLLEGRDVIGQESPRPLFFALQGNFVSK